MSDSTNVEPDEPPVREESLAFGVLLALLAGLPFLVSIHPQQADYPSHLARHHVMLNGTSSPFLERYYTFEWLLNGNLGADLLMWPLGAIFGVELGGWLMGISIPILIGLGIVAVAWTLRRRTGLGTVLAMATIWSPMMAMGLYNFNLSVALALFAFVAWVKLADQWWRWALFIPVGMLTWLCHASGWGVLGVMVFGYEWHQRRNASAFLAPWPLFAPFALVLGAGANAHWLSYGPEPLIYKISIWLKGVSDQEMTVDLLTIMWVVLAVVAAGMRRRWDWRIGWPALLLVGLTFAIPRHLGGVDFADWRLVPIALMVACLAVDWRAPRALVALTTLLVVVRIGVTTVAWHQESTQLAADLGALEKMPEGARVAAAVVTPRGRWSFNPFQHAPSYATVYRDALVNSHFAVPGIHLLQVRENSKFASPTQRVIHDGEPPVDLTNFGPTKLADYIWYFGDMEALLPEGAEVLYQTDHSVFAKLPEVR